MCFVVGLIYMAGSGHETVLLVNVRYTQETAVDSSNIKEQEAKHNIWNVAHNSPSSTASFFS